MTVHYETSGAVLRLTIDNGRHNLLTGGMYQQLCEMFTNFMNDGNLKVAILRGSEGNSFSAGDDLKERPRPSAIAPHYPSILWGMTRNKPIIGVVDQWCMGGGFAVLLTATDMRIASPEAKFGFPEVAYGLGGLGGASRLGRLLPRPIAMEMLLTGDYMTAAEAKRYDLVNRIVPAEELDAAATEFAGRVARHPLIGIQTEMSAFNGGGDLSKSDAVELTKTLGRYQQKLNEVDNAYDDLEIQRPAPLNLQ